jgi:UDP-glucose 4-epimerase
LKGITLNILVTGGAGFIGSNLTRMLLKNGHRVKILDNFSIGKKNNIDHLDIEIIEGDILDPAVVSMAIKHVNGVVHLAAQTGVPGSIDNPIKDCQVNILGTLNMLEACREQDIKRFVFASSNAPLGRQKPPATEDKAPLPVSPYGASKLAGEGYCLAYNGSWSLGSIVLRFANIYGPYSIHKNSVVAKFFKDIINKGSITIDGDGQQTRDFIYVEDLCRAIELALESNISGEIFQIATGVETSILELAEKVKQISSQLIGINHNPPRQGDIRKNFSEISKARNLLGWTPYTELNEGLQNTWNWFEQVSRQN